MHAETVRVVDEQMQDLGVQMQDLDGLVTRATSRNDEHLSQHATSMAKMADAVTTTFAELSSHVQETIGRAEAFMEEAEADANGMRDSWAPAEAIICQPLADLRECVANSKLQEYVPTGDTPEKVQYKYAMELPRTAPYHVIISALHGQRGGDAGGRQSNSSDGDDFGDELLDTMPSPTKTAALFGSGHTTTVPVIFNDLDASRPSFSRASSQPPLSFPEPSVFSMSLREVNPNLTTGSIMFDPRASTMSVQGARNDDRGAASIEGGSKDSGNGGSRTLSLFRRSTRQHNQPPPAKQAKARGASMAFDGRENVPPAVVSASAFSQSLSRRRSPRLN